VDGILSFGVSAAPLSLVSSADLLRVHPPPKPFEQGRKCILFEKSLENQMSKGVQSIAAAINDAMVNDFKYLGYS